jgi:hypothetical protein
MKMDYDKNKLNNGIFNPLELATNQEHVHTYI